MLKLSNRPVLPLMSLAEVFQVVVEMTRATHREIDRLDRRVSDVQQRYESAQQELTNRRLGLLTAISVIFMPLTLIAGIYGMNFDFMPELHFRYGYLMVLAVMALLAAWLYRRIRTRWLQEDDPTGMSRSRTYVGRRRMTLTDPMLALRATRSSISGPTPSAPMTTIPISSVPLARASFAGHLDRGVGDLRQRRRASVPRLSHSRSAPSQTRGRG